MGALAAGAQLGTAAAVDAKTSDAASAATEASVNLLNSASQQVDQGMLTQG
jgi:hypothetical protein